ncbi:MAG: hypothetical protein BZY88_09655 [SAR202 cluster bacterium Io17-Chloro-G9]|nr:MAG: hypothetical protein BZY88_09655 [SAR202 cluster bacterium Io17-Chloro-G9]
MNFQFLEFQHTPPLAKVILSAPLESNRINGVMAEEIRLVCQTIAEDDTLGLAVFTGSGGFFSVGREVPDLGSRAGSQIGPQVSSLETWINQHQVAAAVASLAVPVLVVINGDALDHGLELALAGDVRIAAQEARFGLTDVHLGTLPWDGGTQRLPRLVGPAWARDMILTGRTIDAFQALAIGLVNQVEPKGNLAAAADKIAQDLVSGGPIAARYAKEALVKGLDLTLSQGLGLEADLNVILQSAADRAEGIRSFKERRPPRFSGS